MTDSVFTLAGRASRIWVAVTIIAVWAISEVRAAEAPTHHWSYSGETGPEHWASEDPAYATCGIGKSQSPVDITSVQTRQLPAIEFDYRTTALHVTDTGHSMQVNYEPGSAITIDGERYELQQFHFHVPSEERVHGRTYSMSAHLVHRNAQGQLAVVAVLLKQGKSNAFLKLIFDNLPMAGTPESSVPGGTLNLADFLPAKHGYYSYDGSLTTPPCSEHVRWLVLKAPVEISAAQIQQSAKHYPRNARPVQPLNGRVVVATED